MQKEEKYTFSEWLKISENPAHITILQFLRENKDKGISTRLYHALKQLSYKIDLVKDVTKKDFLSIRNAGSKSWVIFCDLTGREDIADT